MAVAKTTDRWLSAFEGCYDANRATALSGVPLSTVHYWARKGVIVPTVSPQRPKRWSYADLLGLRMVSWLRHPKSGEQPIAPSPMGEVRRALDELAEAGLDIWSSEDAFHTSRLKVDRTGRIYIGMKERTETTFREGVFDRTLDLFAPFETAESHGPDLLRPRPHLRIVPGKVSGEPHIVNSRVTTQTIAALFDRYQSAERVASLYPDLSPQAIQEAIDLELQLAA